MKKYGSIAAPLALTVVSALAVVVLMSVESVPNVFAFTGSNAIGANLIVPNLCITAPANALIGFPPTSPGSFAPTANAENVAVLGSTTSNIWVSGSDWANVPNGAPTFKVGNTLWSATSGGNIGTQLPGAATDTKIPVVTAGASFGNVVFFGLNIPVGTTAGAYNQVITISSSC